MPRMLTRVGVPWSSRRPRHPYTDRLLRVRIAATLLRRRGSRHGKGTDGLLRRLPRLGRGHWPGLAEVDWDSRPRGCGDQRFRLRRRDEQSDIDAGATAAT